MPRDTKTASVGFEAEVLDPVIAAALDRLTKAVKDVETVRGTLEPHLAMLQERLVAQLAAGNIADATLLAQAERLIEWLGSYAKTALTLGKLVDETSRLRSFAAGGADSRPDLSGMSEADLAKIVRDAVKGEASA